MHTARYVEQIRDAFRATARRAGRGEGGVVQASKGPVPVRLKRGWRRLQQRVALGLCAQGGGKELLGSRQVMDETSPVVALQ